jgi:hypothetical protein
MSILDFVFRSWTEFASPAGSQRAVFDCVSGKTTLVPGWRGEEVFAATIPQAVSAPCAHPGWCGGIAAGEAI